MLQHLTDFSIPIAVFVANLGLNIGSPRLYIEYSATEEAYIQATNGQACYSLVRGLLPGMLLVSHDTRSKTHSRPLLPCHNCQDCTSC